MTMFSRAKYLIGIGAIAVGLGGCMHAEDPLVPYVQRTGKITMSAGNSTSSNLAIHMIDPWPKVSASRRLPTNGQRMSDAYERYRDVTKQPTRPIIYPVQSISTSTTSGGASGAGAASSAR